MRKDPGGSGTKPRKQLSPLAASVSSHRTAPFSLLQTSSPFLAAFALPSPLRFRHGPARLPLLAPLPPPLCAATDAAPSPPAQPRLPRRARRSRESAFGGGCCFEEVQILQERCETGLQDWECSHSCCCTCLQL